MKKLGLFLFLILFIVSLLLVSCYFLQSYGSEALPFQATTEVGQKYESLLGLMSKFGTKSINTLFEFADLDSFEAFNDTSARFLTSSSPMFFDDVLELISFHPLQVKKSCE